MEATDQEKHTPGSAVTFQKNMGKKKKGAPLHPPRRLKLKSKSVTSSSCDM